MGREIVKRDANLPAKPGQFSMASAKDLIESLVTRDVTLAELVPSRIKNPQGFVRRLARSVGHQCMKNPKLLKCKPETMLHSVMFCAEIGMAPDPASSLVSLVPFKDEVVPLVEYKGIQSLAMETEKVHYIKSVPVFEDDEFEMIEGTSPEIRHKPNLSAERTKEACIGCYAIAPMVAGGPPPFAWMTKKEIQAIEASSPSKKRKQFSAWDTHWLEMAKKTLIHRLGKNLPLSPEFTRSASMAENYEAGISPWTRQGLDTSAGRHRFEDGFSEEPQKVEVEVEERISQGAYPTPEQEAAVRGGRAPDDLGSDEEIPF